MDRELPQIILNTAGYLGVFNMGRKPLSVNVPVDRLFTQAEAVSAVWKKRWRNPWSLHEVWTGEKLPVDKLELKIGPLGPFESRLYRLDDTPIE